MNELDNSTETRQFCSSRADWVEAGVTFQLADGTIVAGNAAAEELLGLTMEQIRGWSSTQSPWQSIYPDGTDFPGEAHPAMVALRTGKPQASGVMGLYRPDGSLIWIEIDAQPLFQSSGSMPYGVVSTFREVASPDLDQIPPQAQSAGPTASPDPTPPCSDLTQHEAERQRAALRESEARNQLAMEVARMFAFEWDLGTDLVKRSVQSGTILGLTGDAVERDQGARYFQRIHPDDRDRFTAILKGLTPQQSSYRTTYRVVCPNGQIVTLEESGRALFDQQGDLIRLIGMSADITDRKQAELEIQKFASLANNSTEFIGICDLNFRPSYINQAGRRIAGLDDSWQPSQGDVRAFYFPEDQDFILQDFFPRVLREGQAEMEIRFRHFKTGEAIWMLHNVYSLKDETGQPIGYATVSRDITKRKESDLRLELAQQVGNAGFFDWRVAEGICYVTGLLRRIAPTHPDGLVHFADWANMLHPEDAIRVQGLINQAFAAQERQLQYDFRVRTLGEELWLSAQAEVEYDQAGQPYRVLGINFDVTDRKRTEAALRQSESRFRRLSEANLIGTIFWSLDGDILDANDAFLQSLGYTRADLAAGRLRWTDLTPPNWVEQDQRAIEQIIATGQSGPFEKEFFRKDGSLVPVLLGNTLFEGSQDQGISFALDLTERKRTEAALRESEQRFRNQSELFDTVMNSIQDYVYVFNLAGEFIYANQRLLDIWGLTAEEAGRKTLRDLAYPSEVETQLLQDIATVIQTKTPTRSETCYTSPTGVTGYFENIMAPVFDPEGRVALIAGTSREITERKQAEQNKQRLLEAERAARLESERANRIKDEFLAVLSHELRSPLNPILGWTKLMQSRNFSPERTAEALATIERNVKLQIQLIDDLLDTARILRGKLSLTTDPVDLVFVIESALDTVRVAANAKSILLHSALTPVGQVCGDSTRLQQIVWNLLSNAIKFTPAQGRIDILLESVADEAQITIRDSGKGIDPAFLPHLFESFRQEDSSISRKYGGLGLGLAIARHLVEAHGGKIGAESLGEGCGATFTVRLPILTREPVLQASSAPEPELNLTGIRVLAIDDELDTRELLTAILRQYGAEILTVASGEELFAALKSFQPDLLISDVGMPDLSGYALIQQLRALPPEQGGQIPAIALTAYASLEDRQRALAAGFQNHLPKPLDPSRLAQVISDLIRGAGVSSGISSGVSSGVSAPEDSTRSN